MARSHQNGWNQQQFANAVQQDFPISVRQVPLAEYHGRADLKVEDEVASYCVAGGRGSACAPAAELEQFPDRQV